MYEAKLKELGIELPEAPKPLAVYIPVKRTGNLLFTAGQIPLKNGKLILEGRVGKDLSLEEGILAAQQCAINCFSVVKSVCGNLDNIEQIVKLTVFVNSSEDFTLQHLVANGASELVGKVFGEAGRHSRSAVGVSQLPMNAPVEVEMIVELKK
jgi:enamine deaminase RidA (YjgF/YER057c/UK114 family)